MDVIGISPFDETIKPDIGNHDPCKCGGDHDEMDHGELEELKRRLANLQ